MNAHSLLAPDNNAAEMRAFEATCQQLAGFDARLNAEFIDGFLCGLAAGPRTLPVAEWLPVLAGDTFERVFADPASHAQALASLTTRLAVLRGQLDPEALLDAPDSIRLSPWMIEWSDEDRQRVLADQADQAEPRGPDDAAQLFTGAVWASGFFEAFDLLPQLWRLPSDEEPKQLFPF